MAGDKGKRINWDGPASETVPESSDVFTLREWARDEIAHGVAMNQLVKQIGCSWSTLNNAVKQPKKQDAKPVQKTRKEPSGSCAEETQPVPTQELGTCWNCRQQFPADSMHPDGDTLECDDCYRNAHEDHDGAPSFPCARCGACDDCSIVEDEVVCQACRRAGWSLCGCGDWFQAKNGETCCWVCADTPGAAGQELVAAPAPTSTPPAARCQRCECEVDGRLIMSGVGTVCEPCADAIRKEWEAEQYPKHAPEPERDALTPFLEHTEAIRAAQAYLRHIGMGDKEVFALGIWLDAWAARGEAA